MSLYVAIIAKLARCLSTGAGSGCNRYILVAKLPINIPAEYRPKFDHLLSFRGTATSEHESMLVIFKRHLMAFNALVTFIHVSLL
jgi:hypothetical protein